MGKMLDLVALKVLLACLVHLPSSCAAPQRIIAVNAGGPSFVAHDDIVYEADRYHNGGEASDYGIRSLIEGAEDPELYQTERYAFSGQDLVYTLPMPQDVDGTFVLTLKFSEVYFSQPGSKVFSIAINGVTVRQDLDIFQQVGKNVAYDEQFEFEIGSDPSTLTIGTTVVDYDGLLEVRFVSTGIDNPKVNALLVTRGSLADYQRKSSRRKRRKKKEPEEGGYELAFASFGVALCFLAPMAYSKFSGGSRKSKRR